HVRTDSKFQTPEFPRLQDVGERLPVCPAFEINGESFRRTLLDEDTPRSHVPGPYPESICEQQSRFASWRVNSRLTQPLRSIAQQKFAVSHGRRFNDHATSVSAASLFA